MPGSDNIAVLRAKNLYGSPDATVNAFLCLDGKVAQLGTTVAIEAAITQFETTNDGSKVRVLDLQNKYAVYPGFIDSHVHFLDGGKRLSGRRYTNIALAASRADVVSTLKAHIAKHQIPPGEWIVGGGWDETRWVDTEPTTISAAWLDEVSTEHPMLLSRWDVHSAVANTAAMKLAGITAETKEPVGGAIERDADGNPTGIVREMAVGLIKKTWPKVDSEESMNNALEAASQYLLSCGVTACASMTSLEFGNLGEIEFLRKKALAGEMPIRAHLAVRVHEIEELAAMEAVAEKTSGYDKASEFVRVGCVKIFADGSLGSRTCCMKRPFNDAQSRPTSCEKPSGMLLHDRAVLIRDVQRVTQLAVDRQTTGSGANWKLCVHAIGDEAVSTVIEALEQASGLLEGTDKALLVAATAEESVTAVRKTGPRIEHCQIITNPDDIQRLASVGGVASVQPLQLVYDGPTVVEALGDRRASMDTYPFRSLLNLGVPLAGGSDWMVVSANILEGIAAAVTRQALPPKGTAPTKQGWEKEGKQATLPSQAEREEAKWRQWSPSECLTVDEAITMYTTEAAKACGWEGQLGKLAEGYAADFVILAEPVDSIVSSLATERLLRREYEEEMPLPDLPGYSSKVAVDATIVGGVVRYARDGSEFSL